MMVSPTPVSGLHAAQPASPPANPAANPTTLAALGALLADPVRAAILLELTDGVARSAGELALLAGLSPPAASAHLRRLVDGGLLAARPEGRRRLFGLASGEVADLVERLATWASPPPDPRRIGPAIRRCRFCYDHLAGRIGVAVYRRLAGRGGLTLGPGGPDLSDAGRAWCEGHAIALAIPEGSRRPLVRLCLDWTERRHHLGGHLGAAIAAMMIGEGYLRRVPGQRAATVTPAGRAFLRKAWEIDPDG